MNVVEPAVIRLASYRPRAPYFGESFFIPPGRHVIHRFDHCEIMTVIEGEGLLEVFLPGRAPRIYPMRPGLLTFFRPADVLRHTTTGGGGIRTRYVSFSESDWRTFADFVGVEPSWATSDLPPMSIYDEGDVEITESFQRVIDRLASGPRMFDLARFWLGVTPRLFPSVTAPVTYGFDEAPAWFTRSLEAMQSEENLRVGLSRFLELAHVSSSYLAMTTRRYLSTSPRELVMTLRLRHAALLLATTSDSVGAISTRCGFASVTYFSTSFRRVHDMTPREYRSRRTPGSGRE